MEQHRTYIAIDLKSFYASAECVDRGLDPLSTHLVVADASRTQKTICLAVSPSLKACGIPGRPRLFEVVQKVKEINRSRERHLRSIQNKGPAEGHVADRSSGSLSSGASSSGNTVSENTVSSSTVSGSTVTGSIFSERTVSGSPFSGRSFSAPELAADPSLEADYIIAVPRMAHYIEYSTKIYEIYLRYIAPEDIHVYSIDEVMMDVTKYLPLYKKTAHELAMEMIRAVLKETGITATAGIGPNLYLCKIAMDIEAKHTSPDEDGVRIAELDEMSYRKKLWGHRPITDFWRVGKGTAKKLARYGMFTMGDVARCSLKDEDLLYKLFGVNAELLIDHAWGWEPCTIDLIKAYKPENRSFSAGQVLPCAYECEKARIVVREMADGTALDLVEKRLVTDQLVLTVVYDNENLSDPEIRRKYTGPVKKDWYGRNAPKPAHGTVNLERHTSSSRRITDAVLDLYDRIVNPDLLVRRIYLAANHVIGEASSNRAEAAAQSSAPRTARDRRKAENTLHGPGHNKRAAGNPAASDLSGQHDSFGQPFYGQNSSAGNTSRQDIFSGNPSRRSPVSGSEYETESVSGFEYETESGSGSETESGSGSGTGKDSKDHIRKGDESSPGESRGEWKQMDLFTDYEALEQEREREKAALEKERKLQEAMLSIRRKYGKNAILKGTSLQDGATMRERNQSIGGHKA